MKCKAPRISLDFHSNYQIKIETNKICQKLKKILHKKAFKNAIILKIIRRIEAFKIAKIKKGKTG